MPEKLRYLVAELKKENALHEKMTDALINSWQVDKRTRVYIEDSVIPGYERDMEHQKRVIDDELKRLLGDKYEECNQTEKLSD